MTREATMIRIGKVVAGIVVALSLGAIVSAEPWPYVPFDELHGLGNHFGEYQNYGGSPYYHDGDDLVTPDGPTETYSVSDGTVTHLTFNDPWYSGIMIGEPVAGGEGWLYWHISSTTFQFDIGDPVQTNDYIGTTASWPVADFHHVHFNKVRGTGGYPWSWYVAIDCPLLHMEPHFEPDPPVFETTYEGDLFAFSRQGTGTMLDPTSLTGDVDIISRIYDIIGLPQWRLNPWKIDYWIEGATQSVPVTNTVTFAGEIPPDNTVTVLYRRQSPLWTQGDYDNRIFYFIVTNTDGDGFVETSDADYSWQTSNFDPGDYWVTVRAEDVAGNVSSESMLCTIAGVTNPDVYLPEDAHDFGPLPPLWTATWNLPVVNVGSDPLSVREINSTNPAFTVDQTHFFVPPDSGVVDVEVSFTPPGSDSYIGTLEISTNDGDEPLLIVSVQGEGLSPESVEDAPPNTEFRIRGTRATPHGGLELSYALDRGGRVEIAVFDAAGRQRRGATVSGLAAGPQTWRWDGKDDLGRVMPSGVYFLRLRFENRTAVGSGVLLR